jgi:hypothetical protein
MHTNHVVSGPGHWLKSNSKKGPLSSSFGATKLAFFGASDPDCLSAYSVPFSTYSFVVRHLFNRYDQHLLAWGNDLWLLSQMRVTKLAFQHSKSPVLAIFGTKTFTDKSIIIPPRELELEINSNPDPGSGGTYLQKRRRKKIRQIKLKLCTIPVLNCNWYISVKYIC